MTTSAYGLVLSGNGLVHAYHCQGRTGNGKLSSPWHAHNAPRKCGHPSFGCSRCQRKGSPSSGTFIPEGSGRGPVHRYHRVLMDVHPLLTGDFSGRSRVPTTVACFAPAMRVLVLGRALLRIEPSERAPVPSSSSPPSSEDHVPMRSDQVGTLPSGRLRVRSAHRSRRAFAC